MWTWLKDRAWPVVWKTLQGWQEDAGFLLSAAMAYYAAFSLLPLCLVMISVLGFLMRISPQAQDEQQEMLKLVAQNAGPWLASQLGALLEGVQARAGLGGPIGLVALLAAAIGVFLQLDYIFDRIWNIQTSSAKTWLGLVRTAVYDRISAFLMLMGVGALLLLVFLANMVLTAIRPYVVELPAGRATWHWGQLAFTLVTNAVLFGLVYKVLPKAPVRWREALAGGALVSVTWLLGQQVLVSLVIGKSYTAYGIVGSFMAVMLWLYYASAVLFLGAEFVQTLCQERESRRPDASAGK